MYLMKSPVIILITLAAFFVVAIWPTEAAPKHKKYQKARKINKSRKYKHTIAPLKNRPKSPGADYIWVERYMIAPGVYAGGYWKPGCSGGFSYVNGYYNELGEWVFGYCSPVEKKPGQLWVPGHYNGSKWVPGYWRSSAKKGHKWKPGYYDSAGKWVVGVWVRL